MLRLTCMRRSDPARVPTAARAIPEWAPLVRFCQGSGSFDHGMSGPKHSTVQPCCGNSRRIRAARLTTITAAAFVAAVAVGGGCWWWKGGDDTPNDYNMFCSTP